jgi:hypothetical protein
MQIKKTKYYFTKILYFADKFYSLSKYSIASSTSSSFFPLSLPHPSDILIASSTLAVSKKMLPSRFQIKNHLYLKIFFAHTCMRDTNTTLLIGLSKMVYLEDLVHPLALIFSAFSYSAFIYWSFGASPRVSRHKQD